MRRIPLRYSPSQTNESSSYLNVSTSSELLLDTPSFTSFQGNGYLTNITLVFIFWDLPLFSLFAENWRCEMIPSFSGIEKVIRTAFSFSGKKDKQITG